MPFAHRVNRVTIGGTAFGGAEIWNTGFYLGKTDGDAADPTVAAADAIRAAWQTFFAAASTGAFSSSHVTTFVKISQIQTDGKTDKAKTQYAGIQTPISGATGVFNPPQIALVATLMSDQARGFAAKGRMYLPPPAAGVDSTGKISTAVRDSIRTNLATFLSAVNAHADVPDGVILASSGREFRAPTETDPGQLELPGVNRLVTQCRVGNVLDTQRRRRNQMVESYAIGTVTA